MKSRTLWTKKDVAERLNLTIRGVEGLMAKRAIPFYRLGNRTVRFDPEEIELWLSCIRVDGIRIE